MRRGRENSAGQMVCAWPPGSQRGAAVAASARASKRRHQCSVGGASPASRGSRRRCRGWRGAPPCASPAPSSCRRWWRRPRPSAGPRRVSMSMRSSTLCIALPERVHAAHLLGLHRDARRCAKIASNAARIAAAPDDARPAGMHADDLVVVGPHRHQLLDVALAAAPRRTAPRRRRARPSSAAAAGLGSGIGRRWRLSGRRRVLWPLQQHAVLDVPAHRAREHHALDVAADGGQVFGRQRVVHALDVLLDDRPLVEVGGHVVRGRADQLHAAVVRLVVRLARP